MKIKRIKDKDEPKGGWLCPPPTEGVPATHRLMSGKKGYKMMPVKLTAAQRKLRSKWEKAMAKADKKGMGRFKWPK